MAVKQIKIGNTTYNLKDKRFSAIETSPSSSNGNPITSGGAYNAIQNLGGKQLKATINDYGTSSGTSGTLSVDDYRELIEMTSLYENTWGRTYNRIAQLESYQLDLLMDAGLAQDLELYEAEEAYWVGMSTEGDYDLSTKNFKPASFLAIFYDNRSNVRRWEVYNVGFSGLTFKVTKPGTITWTCTNANIARTIQYKKNGGDWIDLTSTTAGASINVVAGDVINWRGSNTEYANEYYSNSFGGTATFKASGNIMSLLNYASEVRETYCFHCLFMGSRIITPPALPARLGTWFIYSYMFANCSNLISAPALPIKNLSSGCYQYMFQNCTSLVEAPEFPESVIMASTCYRGMFMGCSNLEKAPTQIKADDPDTQCCSAMFAYCTSLKSSPQMIFSNASHLDNELSFGQMFLGCSRLNHITFIGPHNPTDFNSWVKGVSSSGTFIGLESEAWVRGNNGVPRDWQTNVQVAVPEAYLYIDDFPDLSEISDETELEDIYMNLFGFAPSEINTQYPQEQLCDLIGDNWDESMCEEYTLIDDSVFIDDSGPFCLWVNADGDFYIITYSLDEIQNNSGSWMNDGWGRYCPIISEGFDDSADRYFSGDGYFEEGDNDMNYDGRAVYSMIVK